MMDLEYGLLIATAKATSVGLSKKSHRPPTFGKPLISLKVVPAPFDIVGGYPCSVRRVPRHAPEGPRSMARSTFGSQA